MHVTPMFANFVAEEFVEINNDELLEYLVDVERKQAQPMFDTELGRAAGGWQSGTLDMTAPQLQPLLSAVDQRCTEISKLLNITVEHNIANCWANRTAPVTTPSLELASSPPHAHANYYIAFVYYPQATDDAGNLVILPPTNTQELAVPRPFIREDNMYTATRMHIPPKTGLLVAFPAWLTHYVEPNRTDTDRISIAVNTRLPHISQEYNP